MADAPLSAWLHMGPNSRASVTVTFIGTHKRFSLTATQVFRLEAALREARGVIASDDGERQHSISIKLLDGTEVS